MTESDKKRKATILFICSGVKLQPKERERAAGRLIRGGPSGDNDSEVSYIRFNFMHSLNVKSGAAKQGWTELAHSVSSPLTMWMFISWQFRQAAWSQSMYRCPFTKSST